MTAVLVEFCFVALRIGHDEWSSMSLIIFWPNTLWTNFQFTVNLDRSQHIGSYWCFKFIKMAHEKIETCCRYVTPLAFPALLCVISVPTGIVFVITQCVTQTWNIFTRLSLFFSVSGHNSTILAEKNFTRHRPRANEIRTRDSPLLVSVPESETTFLWVSS